jgi:hypothetical protein
MARKQLVMAAYGLPVLVLVPCRQVTGRTWSAWERARVAQGCRRAGIGRLRRPTQPAVGPGLRGGIAVVRGGAALDRDRVLPAGLGQLLAEQGVIAVADVGGHHRPGTVGGSDQVPGAPPAGPGHLGDHVQRQPPLLPGGAPDRGCRPAASGGTRRLPDRPAPGHPSFLGFFDFADIEAILGSDLKTKNYAADEWLGFNPAFVYWHRPMKRSVSTVKLAEALVAMTIARHSA